jgi:hypothetical protein
MFYFFLSRRLWDNVEIYRRHGQATGDYITRRKKNPLCLRDN